MNFHSNEYAWKSFGTWNPSLTPKYQFFDSIFDSDCSKFYGYYSIYTRVTYRYLHNPWDHRMNKIQQHIDHVPDIEVDHPIHHLLHHISGFAVCWILVTALQLHYLQKIIFTIWLILNFFDDSISFLNSPHVELNNSVEQSSAGIFL